MSTNTRPPVRTDTTRAPINRKHISKRAAGDLQAYRQDGCRCYPCSGAWARYHKQRQHADWKPFTDAQPIRDHLAYLSANGVGMARIAELADTGRSTIEDIKGVGGKPATTRVRTDLAERILAVKPGIQTAADGAYIDATGAFRRLRALNAKGFTAQFLAQRLGLLHGQLHLSDAPRYVRASFARAVLRLYDELWLAEPEQFDFRPSSVTLARNRAAAAGWPLPAEWDDDEIDDPAAQPHRARRTDDADDRPVTKAEVEDTQWIIATLDVDVTKKAGREFAAARLGIKPARLEYIVTRKLPKLERQAVAA
jgi:hypothetical protein